LICFFWNSIWRVILKLLFIFLIINLIVLRLIIYFCYRTWYRNRLGFTSRQWFFRVSRYFRILNLVFSETYSNCVFILNCGYCLSASLLYILLYLSILIFQMFYKPIPFFPLNPITSKLIVIKLIKLPSLSKANTKSILISLVYLI